MIAEEVMSASNDGSERFANAAREAREAASEKQRKTEQEKEAKRLAQAETDKRRLDELNANIESIWNKLVAFQDGVDVSGLLKSLANALGVVCAPPKHENKRPFYVRTSVVLRHPVKRPIFICVSAKRLEPGIFTSWRIALNVYAISRDPTTDATNTIWQQLGSAWNNDMAKFHDKELAYSPNDFALGNDFSAQTAWICTQLEKITRDCAEYYASDRQ